MQEVVIHDVLQLLSKVALFRFYSWFFCRVVVVIMYFIYIENICNVKIKVHVLSNEDIVVQYIARSLSF